MSQQTIDLNKLMTKKEFETCLRKIGETRYHNLHPFHKLLHEGKLNKGQVQAWALNRYYYQCSIPIKDSAVMSRMKEPDLRRIWRKRILDHDGESTGSGGIERWYKLTDGLGLDREYVKSTDGILSTTRFAVDAYVNFVENKSLLEGIASSLTEIYAPAIHQERIAGLSKHYEWADDYALAYFKKRINQARKDVEFGREWVINNAISRSDQEAVLNAVKFKTEVLWAQLDALYHSYVDPGNIPPGAFVPEGLSKNKS